jgi:hypothetical protein
VCAEKSRLAEYQYKQQNADNYMSPSMKAHYAVLAIQQSHYVDMLETFYDLAESLIVMHKQIGSALDSLQRQIEEISHKTGVDISTVSTKIDELHTTFSSKKIDSIASFLDSMKKTSERNNLASDQYVE